MKIVGWKCDICGEVMSSQFPATLETAGSFHATVRDVVHHEWNYPEICDECASSLVGALDAVVNTLKERKSNGI